MCKNLTKHTPIKSGCPLLRRSCLLSVVLLLNACTHVAVWERGTLTKPIMQVQADGLNAALRQHVLASKEASSGGQMSGGGGCGCN